MSAIETYPIAPETVTVLGHLAKATDPMWLGLDFSRAVVRKTATIMVFVCGSEAAAPFDLHLNVPWCHPNDQPWGWDDDCWYRVRPRAEVGKRWRGRVVKSVAIVAAPALDPPWALEIGRARAVMGSSEQ